MMSIHDTLTQPRQGPPATAAEARRIRFADHDADDEEYLDEDAHPQRCPECGSVNWRQRETGWAERVWVFTSGYEYAEIWDESSEMEDADNWECRECEHVAEPDLNEELNNLK